MKLKLKEVKVIALGPVLCFIPHAKPIAERMLNKHLLNKWMNECGKGVLHSQAHKENVQ